MSDEKQETLAGNTAKLREALSKFCAYSAVVLNTGMFNRVHLEALLNMAKAALAEPIPVPPVPPNAAKFRAALGRLRAELWNNTVIAGKRKFDLYEIADAALAAPPRNCDFFHSGVPETDAQAAWDAYDGNLKLEVENLSEREYAMLKEFLNAFRWLFSQPKKG